MTSGEATGALLRASARLRPDERRDGRTTLLGGGRGFDNTATGSLWCAVAPFPVGFAGRFALPTRTGSARPGTRRLMRPRRRRQPCELEIWCWSWAAAWWG